MSSSAVASLCSVSHFSLSETNLVCPKVCWEISEWADSSSCLCLRASRLFFTYTEIETESMWQKRVWYGFYTSDQSCLCLHTVVSSVRSCWFRLLLSSRRDSRLWIFSSLSSRVFFSADSIFVSRILYLLKVDKVKLHVIFTCQRVDQSETALLTGSFFRIFALK